ncbi:MAG: class I mannose-6-phosphate isomerase [Bacilli bacterium]|nr:class I mannose-6-phosphate isomerase [Bacilli bacterium]MBR0301770.1 class I mannose-6-phosphate isomerase [Bacilli bacterium]
MVVKLKPVVKSYIWGGSYFQQFKNIDLDVVSELWELSVRGLDSSIIDSGKNKGKRLDEILSKEDIGPVADQMPFFPLLIKLIDAKENLSVQVHPSDEYAINKLNSFGKTEMWHIINADEGCGLYVGFKKDYSRKEVEESLNNGTILDLLNFFKVKPGDTFFIEAGTIHAIGKGVRLIEIQQNSDITYRLYDYLRKDKNGNYRELHIKQALDVINYKKYEKPQVNQELLAKSKYFTVKRVELNRELELVANKNSFITFTFLDGEGEVDGILYKKFDTFFLPYGHSCHIKGKGTLIISEV